MLLHNYRSRQFHSTLNGINPSSGFRDIGSTSLAQVLLDLTSFWPMGKPIWGKWANNYAVVQLQVSTSPRNFKWAKSIQQFQIYACHNVWTQFVANLTSFWPMGKPIWGKWAYDHNSAQLQGKTIPQNFERRKSVKRFQRYGCHKFWQPRARPPGPWRQYSSSPEGWVAKGCPAIRKGIGRTPHEYGLTGCFWGTRRAGPVMEMWQSL